VNMLRHFILKLWVGILTLWAAILKVWAGILRLWASFFFFSTGALSRRGICSLYPERAQQLSH
jgi:hypothetical protein